jgi:hypothetical protein
MRAIGGLLAGLFYLLATLLDAAFCCLRVLQECAYEQSRRVGNLQAASGATSRLLL